MNGRLWYPQLDVYDGIRRLGALLTAYHSPTGVERLYIADFYLANPPLLHRTQMSLDIRRSFRTLGVPHPAKTFLTYPAPQLLYKKMEPVQREALRAMTGKGLLSLKQYQRGFGQLTDSGNEAFRQLLLGQVSKGEDKLICFLTTEFAPLESKDVDGLRRSTGLRRGRW